MRASAGLGIEVPERARERSERMRVIWSFGFNERGVFEAWSMGMGRTLTF